MRICSRPSLIIAVCLLTTVGLQIAVSWSQWVERKAQLADLAVHQADLLASDMESIAEGARILLGAATEFHQIRIGGEECSSRLAGLLRHAVGFAFLALADREGLIRCASDPALLAERRAAWARGGNAAASFIAGGFTRLPAWPGGILPFYLPLAAAGLGGDHTLIAAIDLGWLEQHLVRLKRAGSPFLANGILTIADSNGIILGRDARHADFVGRPFPPSAMSLLRATQPGTLRLESIDGTVRVIGYIPPSPASHNLVAAVGFHEPELMVDLEWALLRGTLLLGVVSAAVFGLTFLAARERLMARFAHRLPPGILEALLAIPEVERLRPERRQVAIILTDLAGSSAMIRRAAPDAVVPVLNAYLTGVEAVVTEHGGTLERLIGDGVIAVFGAPVPQSDHGRCALAAARAVDRFAEAFRIRPEAAALGWGETRIGVAVGEVLAGEIGGSRLTWTVCGDPANMAARLQELAKSLGRRGLVTGIEDPSLAPPLGRFELRDLPGEVVVHPLQGGEGRLLRQGEGAGGAGPRDVATEHFVAAIAGSSGVG